MKRVIVTTACGIGAFLVAATGRAGSLSGEIFAASSVGATGLVASSCDPSTSSSFTFRTSGIALGPVPGTFVETVTVRIGSQTGEAWDPTLNGPPSGVPTQVTAQFEIFSPFGHAVGRKRLSHGPAAAGNIATCGLAGSARLGICPYSVFDQVDAAVRYEARLETAGGSERTRGHAQLGLLAFVQDCPTQDFLGYSFRETFQ